MNEFGEGKRNIRTVADCMRIVRLVMFVQNSFQIKKVHKNEYQTMNLNKLSIEHKKETLFYNIQVNMIRVHVELSTSMWIQI